jgi:hypothetical protein
MTREYDTILCCEYFFFQNVFHEVYFFRFIQAAGIITRPYIIKVLLEFNVLNVLNQNTLNCGGNHSIRGACSEQHTYISDRYRVYLSPYDTSQSTNPR